jgi:hypothetical protein
VYRPTTKLRDGVAGNARLTGAAAAPLLVLLAAEGATIPFIGQLLGPHIFIGMLLIPPVALMTLHVLGHLLEVPLAGQRRLAPGRPARGAAGGRRPADAEPGHRDPRRRRPGGVDVLRSAALALTTGSISRDRRRPRSPR